MSGGLVGRWFVCACVLFILGCVDCCSNLHGYNDCLTFLTYMTCTGVPNMLRTFVIIYIPRPSSLHPTPPPPLFPSHAPSFSPPLLPPTPPLLPLSPPLLPSSPPPSTTPPFLPYFPPPFLHPPLLFPSTPLPPILPSTLLLSRSLPPSRSPPLSLPAPLLPPLPLSRSRQISEFVRPGVGIKLVGV